MTNSIGLMPTTIIAFLLLTFNSYNTQAITKDDLGKSALKAEEYAILFGAGAFVQENLPFFHGEVGLRLYSSSKSLNSYSLRLNFDTFFTVYNRRYIELSLNGFLLDWLSFYVNSGVVFGMYPIGHSTTGGGVEIASLSRVVSDRISLRVGYFNQYDYTYIGETDRKDVFTIGFVYRE